jgi:hypothetical protein
LTIKRLKEADVHTQVSFHSLLRCIRPRAGRPDAAAEEQSIRDLIIKLNEARNTHNATAAAELYVGDGKDLGVRGKGSRSCGGNKDVDDSDRPRIAICP